VQRHAHAVSRRGAMGRRCPQVLIDPGAVAVVLISDLIAADLSACSGQPSDTRRVSARRDRIPTGTSGFVQVASNLPKEDQCHRMTLSLRP
jgi:hypothetical protein